MRGYKRLARPILGAFAAGCVDQISTQTPDASIVDSHGEDCQSEDSTQASDASTADSFDACQTTIADRVADDKCVVIDGTHCEDNCMPLYSSNFAQTYCAVEGVFFGCVPAVSTGFWDTCDEIIIGQYAACDVLIDDPKQYLYCFEAPYGLYWCYKHRDNGWCQGECLVSPDAVPCE